jgi:hypothetical protein
MSGSRLVNDFDFAGGMHEIKVEVDLSSSASAKAILKCGVVRSVVAFGKRRKVWFRFVVGELRHSAVSVLAVQVVLSAHSERNIFVCDLGRAGVNRLALIVIPIGPILTAAAVLV